MVILADVSFRSVDLSHQSGWLEPIILFSAFSEETCNRMPIADINIGRLFNLADVFKIPASGMEAALLRIIYGTHYVSKFQSRLGTPQ